MKNTFFFVCVTCISFFTCSTVSAESLDEIFAKVNEYKEKGNFTKALNELEWAKKELFKLHTKKLGTLLPDTVDGYKGSPVEVNAAMGISALKKIYNKDGEKIELSLAGGTGGANNPMAGLAGIGKMASMFGGMQPGLEQIRIEGRTANIDTKGRYAELSLFLESGSILSLKKKKKTDSVDELASFAKALNISELDAYLRGAK